MGIESFNILVRAERNASMDFIKESVLAFGNIKFVETNELGDSYEYFDDKYLFEILIRGDDLNSEFDINIRFALCNEDGIEDVFLSFVKSIAERWNLTIYLLSSILKERNFFDRNETQLFFEKVSLEIQALRLFWQKNFGNKRGPIRPDDVFGWIEQSNN
jgi:hypothetical protein